MDQILKTEYCYSELKSEVGQAILKNEWIHVEVQLIHNHMEDRYLRFGNPQIGIHVFKEKETMEADVRFSNPYRKRKSDGYQNDLFLLHSQLRPFKKQRTCVEFEIGEL
jgi:hypothetical protein